MVIKLYRYRLPTNTLQWKFREGLVLQIGENFGDIAPLPGFSRETLDEALRETLDWIQFQKEPTLPSVRWGIACAHTSLRSIHHSLSALGVKPHFSTLKLKLGHLSVPEAIALVRPLVGSVELRLDCNSKWTLDQALAFASHFRPTDFAFWEEPVQTWEELIEFSQKTSFPIALDHWISQDWSQIPSLKTIVIKPTLVGEIPHVPPHLQLILSSSYESGLGLLHIANRAIAPHPLGLDTYSALQEDILANPIDCSRGIFSWKAQKPLLNLSKIGYTLWPNEPCRS